MTRTHTLENPHRVVYLKHSERRIGAVGHGRVLEKQRDKVLELADNSRQCTGTNETPVSIYSSNEKTGRHLCFRSHVALHTIRSMHTKEVFCDWQHCATRFTSDTKGHLGKKISVQERIYA